MTPYYQDEWCTLYHGDCREILPELEAVDCCIADPPYAETSCSWDVLCDGWLDSLPTSCLWCFGSMRFFLENAAEFKGWKFAQDLIWEKQNGSGFAVERFNRVHEIITHWYRGKWSDLYTQTPRIETNSPSKNVRTRGQTPHRGIIGAGYYVDDGMRLERSVVRMNNEHGKSSHPTQKPVSLIELILSYSCPPAGVVLDPFAGSGTTGVAAKQLGRKAILIELEEKYCEIAADRLRNTTPSLFAAPKPTSEQLSLLEVA